jgi:hypothetical protein
VRLADAILRQGHLSEQALIEVCMTGERPAHLDRCDICAERAVELGRWLDDVRTTGMEDADAAFPAERLAAQEAQILRRLEQIDRPARVLSFPAQSRYDRMDMAPTGIRPAWVGVAAAAGLVLGLLGGQISARLSTAQNVPPSRPSEQVQQAPATVSVTPSAASEDLPLLPLDATDRTRISSVSAIDAFTPHIVRASGLVLGSEQ